MKRATVSADGETIIVHIPMTFRKRGGRKLVVTPDGAALAPRPRVDNAMVKALVRAWEGQKKEVELPAVLPYDRTRLLADGIGATGWHSWWRTAIAPQLRFGRGTPNCGGN